MSNRPPPSSFDDNEAFYETSILARLGRHCREEPLIPLGMALTVWAFVGASKSIRKGDHHEANRMFRRRIYAQGFTIVAMMAGSVYLADEKKKRKELEGLLSEAKRKEKTERWVKELEAREEDDRAERELMRRRKEEEVQRFGGTSSVVEAIERRETGLGILGRLSWLRRDR